MHRSRYWKRLLLRMLSGLLMALLVVAFFALLIKYTAADTIAAVAALTGKTDILFGTATVILTFFGIITTIIGIFGWTSIREKVEFEVSRAMAEERKYDRAHSNVVTGAIYGVVAETVIKKDVHMLLENAIRYDEQALASEAIKGTDIEWKAQNNLAYALAVRSALSGGRKGDAATALELARKAWQKTSGNKDYRVATAATLGRVTAEFALSEEEEPAKHLRKTLLLIQAIAKEQALDHQARHELEFTVRKLEGVLQKAEEAKIPDSDAVGDLAVRLTKALWKRLRLR